MINKMQEDYCERVETINISIGQFKFSKEVQRCEAKRCSACVSMAFMNRMAKSRNIILLLLKVIRLAGFARTMTGIQEIIGGWTKLFGYQRCCRVA